MKTGLVLEGGALRGLYSAGIFDVLLENQIKFDGLIGVSAGAAFGCNYKSGQAGRVIRYSKRFAKDWRYCSLRSLFKTGDLFGGEFDYHYMPEKLDIFDIESFEKNPMEYYAVCTDLETGEAVYKKLMKYSYEFCEWIRASASMPLVSRIVNINGQKLLDGGITDSIPLSYFQSLGYEKNIVVLTQPDGYQKKPNSLMPLMKWQLRKYPNFLKAAANRHLMYNEQLKYVEEQEKAGNILVFRPKIKLPINHITSDKNLMQEVYDLGKLQAEERIDEVKKFLQI